MASELFPPRNLHEARQLAALGAEAIPHLQPRPEADESWNITCARCLRLISTKDARAMLCRYLDTEALAVAEELVGWFDPLQIRAIAQAVRSRERWEKVSLSIKSSITDLRLISEFQDARQLWLSETGITDAGLAHLAKLAGLQWLSLGGTAVTADGAKRLRKAFAAQGNKGILFTGIVVGG
jgi:hypothetical protein